MKKISSGILFFILCVANIYAQDFHLSQYDAAPQHLNPALTGMNIDDASGYRINANYRAQWRSILPKPFTTAVIGGDSHTKRYGYGGYIINNSVGAGNINAMNIALSGAYRITNDPNGKHNLTVGVQAGMLQRSFNLNKLNFDAQYSIDNGGFDPSTHNGEDFLNSNVLRFDAGLGVNYAYKDAKQKADYFGGFSLFHVTKPNISFTGEKYKLPMRWVFNGGVNIKLTKELLLVPNVLFMTQAKAYDLNSGLMAFYKIDKVYQVLGGLSYRLKDAYIIHTGLKHKNNTYRISYDINHSLLKEYSRGRGALEFSVIYNGNPKKKSVSKI